MRNNRFVMAMLNLALAACGAEPTDAPQCHGEKCDSFETEVALGEVVAAPLGGCGAAGARPLELSTEMVGGGLRISHTSPFQSAFKLGAQVTVEGDTIRIEERDVSEERARCDSFFRVAVDVCGGIPAGTYDVLISGPRGEEIGRTSARVGSFDTRACLASPLGPVPIERVDFPGVCADVVINGLGDRLFNAVSPADDAAEYALSADEKSSAELVTTRSEWLRGSTLALEDARDLFQATEAYSVLAFDYLTVNQTVGQGAILLIRDQADLVAFEGQEIGDPGARFTPSGVTAVVYYFTEHPRELTKRRIPCHRITELRPERIEPESCQWVDGRRDEGQELPLCF